MHLLLLHEIAKFALTVVVVQVQVLETACWDLSMRAGCIGKEAGDGDAHGTSWQNMLAVDIRKLFVYSRVVWYFFGRLYLYA